MTNSSSNASDESNVEKSVKKDKETLKIEFLRDFSNDYFPEGGANTTVRLNELFENDSKDIPASTKLGLEKFQAKNGKYGEIKIEDINAFQLRNAVSNEYLALKNARENLKKLVESEYKKELDTDKKGKLEAKLEKLSISEINKLQKNTIERRKFLEAEKLIPKNLARDNRIKEFFKSKNILVGYETFNEDKKEAIQDLFTKYGQLRNVDTTTLSQLFETGVFDREQKIELTKLFFPTILVEDLRRFKIFGDKTEIIINGALDGLIKEEFHGFDEDKIKNIRNSISESDFEINLSELLEKNGDIDEKSLTNFLTDSLYLEDFARAYNQGLDDILDDVSAKRFPEGLKSFREELTGTGKIGNIENFKSGNYIVLELSPRNSKDGAVSIKQFYKIIKNDNGNCSFKLQDAGENSINLSTDSSSEKDFNFGNFIDFLKNGSKDLEVKNCGFHTKATILEKISNGEINTIPEKSEAQRKIDFEKQKNLEEYKGLRDDLFGQALKIHQDNPNFDLGITDAKEANKNLDDARTKLVEAEENLKEIRNVLLLDDNQKLKDREGELIKEIEDLEQEIIGLENARNNAINDFIGDLSEEKIALFDDIETIEKINDLKERLGVNAENLADLELEEALFGNLNERDAKQLFDEFDKDGSSYDFIKGLSFTIGGWNIYTVKEIDWGRQEITIINGEGLEETGDIKSSIELFKEKGAKRLSTSTDSQNLVRDISEGKNVDTDLASFWAKFEFDNGVIKDKKEDGKDKKILEYEYLVADDSVGLDQNLLKIENISGDKVTISVGEFNRYKKDKEGNFEKDKDGKKVEQGSYGTAGSYLVSISWLETWIKSNKAKPRNFEAENVKEKENIKEADRKFSLGSFLGSRLSISDIIAGGKLWVDSIDAWLKEGREEHATQFAQGFLGKVLPEGLRDDLMTRMEEAQKKRADAYVTKLNNVDSWKATQMIEKWLLTTNSPPYMVEAGLSFMFQKYGVLYAKSGLYKYKGTFLWYTALGGKIGDELYENTKRQMEEVEGVPFTEEELVYQLVKKQGGSDWRKWGIKRRSRLHKEVKRFRDSGKKEDYESGKGDASSERTVEGRIRGGLGELKGGTYPNMRGWLEQVVDKGGSMAEMNKIPFLIAFSGAAYSFEQGELDALKNFPAKSMLLPMLRMMSFKSDTDLLNETILEVSRKLSDVKEKPEIYTKAKKIFGNLKKVPPSEKDKIDEAEKFYNEYGEDITGMLYMLNAGKGSPLNKVILVEKDDWIGKDGVKHSGNNTFKRYYDKFAGLHGESSYANDDLMSDAFAEKGTSGMTHTGMKKAAKACLSSRQGGGFNMSKSGGWMLKEVANEIKAIKDADDDYGGYGIEGKKVALKLILKGLCSGLLDAHSGQNSWLDSIFTDPDSPINLIFYSAGIQNLKKIRDAKIGFSDLANEDSPNYEKANKIIDEYVSEILRESSPVGDTKSDVQFNVSDAIRNAKSSNDESYKQRA